ncbi:hypothetical protein [Pseudomonas phage HZ2201]|nr:hypothetical protein [Pseudomonas phage HZ2201]
MAFIGCILAGNEGCNEDHAQADEEDYHQEVVNPIIIRWPLGGSSDCWDIMDRVVYV